MSFWGHSGKEESILKVMASQKDYYDILGIRRNATEDEIAKAYRKLARTYQGNLPPGNKTAEWRLREIAEAYEILSNKEKRAKYDQWGPDIFFPEAFLNNLLEEEWGEDGSHWEGFEDVFEGYFRAKDLVTSRPPQKGKDLVFALEIEFEEAIRGSIVDLQVEREKECNFCSGKGVDPQGTQKICQACGGACQIQIGLLPDTFTQSCPHCGGQGRIPTQRCTCCSGKGWMEERIKVLFEVPPGVDDGCRIYKIGMGHASHWGGPKGDLVAEINVRPHSYFTRRGKDLHIEVPLTPWEAALGVEIEIPTLHGAEKLNIPAGTANGEEARLSEKGVPLLNEGKKGDEVITFRLDLPPDLDEKTKAILAELKRTSPLDLRSGLGWRLKHSE